jgi:hypothetical protein
MEQGQANRTKATVEASGDLGDSNRLQMSSNIRELALFNLASKLRACDLTRSLGSSTLNADAC